MYTGRRRFPSFLIATGTWVIIFTSTCAGQRLPGDCVSDWFTFSANLDEAGYRRTDFFLKHYNTGIFDWDSRAEFWLPFRRKFSWGFYARFAGIAGLRDDPWLKSKGLQDYSFPNALLGGPGVGFQAYPFSFGPFLTPGRKAGEVLGPLRFFAEYNRTDYLGAENSWRPKRQSRIGFEYWKTVNVNDLPHRWWLEIWNGFYRQSSNEFTPHYDSWIFANSWRAGIRIREAGILSMITPYLVVESSRTKFDRPASQPCFLPIVTTNYPKNPNPCDFYWENHLLGGGGFRYAPSLTGPNWKWLQRFVFYTEYETTATYYGPKPPPPAPRWEARAGVSASFGQWYYRLISP